MCCQSCDASVLWGTHNVSEHCSTDARTMTLMDVDNLSRASHGACLACRMVAWVQRVERR